MPGPKKILVVDDEPSNRNLLMRALETMGHESVLANNGLHAIDLMSDEIDLVLLDVIMPGMDGFGVCQWIRDHPDFRDIPVVMVTVLDSKEDRIRAVESGANDFIAKPIELLELRVRVRSLLKMKEAQDWVKSYAKQLENAVQERTASLCESEAKCKRLYEEAKRSEELFRAIFETAQDSMFLKDAELKYTHVNPTMLKILELPPVEVIGKTDEHLFGYNTAEAVRPQELRVLEGVAVESEQTFTCKATPLTFSLMRFPIKGPDGAISGLCGIARDVTDRKRILEDENPCAQPYTSEAMRRTLEQLNLVARTDSTVLLLGENGSGKDYLARLLHENSRRAAGPFLNLNCAALASELAESELFGHESGSFTGARGRKRGLFELAEGGALLLNEVGELSPTLQAKLLTFLDTQTFTRVGGEKVVSVNVRLIAATNRDLDAEIKAGRFREDLFFRLNVFCIRVPALRERMEDLPILTQDILPKLGEKIGRKPVPRLSVEAVDALAAYHWPGNIRELRNILERALILCQGDVISVEHLGLPRADQPNVDYIPQSRIAGLFAADMPMQQALHETKLHLVTEALRKSEGNVTRAAELLGLTRESLKHHLRTLGIRGCKPTTGG